MAEVDSRNEVEIDLEKYDELINSLHDKEKEIARLKADALAQKKAIEPKKKRKVLDYRIILLLPDVSLCSYH